jgi:hypothetical protein
MTNIAPDPQAPAALAADIADARRREMAVEHLLFGTLRFLAHRHPELVTELEGSLGHLWDRAEDGTRDDEALRAVARRFIKSLRAES